MKRQCDCGKEIAMSGTVVDTRSPCPTLYAYRPNMPMLIHLAWCWAIPNLAHNAPAQRIEWFALFS